MILRWEAVRVGPNARAKLGGGVCQRQHSVVGGRHGTGKKFSGNGRALYDDKVRQRESEYGEVSIYVWLYEALL